MLYLLNPRVWIAAALLAVLAGTHLTAYRSGRAAVTAAWEKEKAIATAKALEAEQAARKREQKLVAQRQQAENRYVQEKRKASAAATATRSDLDRLRDELAAAPASCPAADPSAAARAASGARLERDLFGACATALADLAQETDRLEALVVGLQQYVKNVCLREQK